MRGSPRVTWTLLLVLVGGATGCGGDGGRRAAARPVERPVVGFLYVGAHDDHGYNQAAYEGSLAMARAFPRARLIQAERVPESSAAEAVMQRMIDAGATVVFPTSFGHLEPALRVAARNPRVVFLHQGGLQTAANLGTYFGTIWEAQYAAGRAAGLTTRTDRLGYVAAFPIAQALLGINAFQLGARSVNPRVRTRVVFTSSWCRPAAQRRAARELLRRRADVLAQHQDCTGTVIREAARDGAKVSGFHVDASALAPDAWLTGAVWDWRRLYVRMVRAALNGSFARSPFADRYRGGLADGTIGLAPFGPTVPARVRSRVTSTLRALRSGRLRVFRGPIRDQAGRIRIRGAEPTLAQLEETDYLVEGVDGRLPHR